jgi:hypothetical protein
MDYSNGKIYRIVVGEHYYIGSTIKDLNHRLQFHKYMSKKCPNLKLYTKIVEYGWDKIKIELIELFPCDSFNQLLQQENTYIKLDDPLCLNCRPSYQTAEESNRKRQELNKKYREDHLEDLRRKNREYKQSRPPKTQEQIEQSRIYQRNYMRERRRIKKLDTNKE